jgi:cytochrome P450
MTTHVDSSRLAAGTGTRQPSLYDLQRPEFIANPWPLYRWLLANDGPYWDRGVRSWLVARHADVSRLLEDRALSAATDHERAARYAPAEIRHIFPLLDAHVSFVDAPEHTRIRQVLGDPFKPRHVQALRAWIGDAVAEALHRCAGTGRMDVVADLSLPVPLRVIRHLLGMEDVELAALHRWSTAWGHVVASPGHLPTGDIRQLHGDLDELIACLHATVTAHRARPRDTVTGFLVRAADDGRLGRAELIGNLMMLVTAGQETTGNLISNAVAALLDRPDLARRLRARPELLPVAVDELARMYPPTQYTVRTARTPIDIAGRRIDAGHSVVLMLAAANRDPAAFQDPDTLRLDRPAQPRPVAFGHGPHFCFGAPLARLETQLVLAGLLDRCTDLRPAGERRWRANGNLRGLAALPVTFRERPRPGVRSGEVEGG